jgi:hypothetical protein
MSGSFHVNLSFSGFVVLEKKIFKMNSPYFCIFVIIPLWSLGPGPLFEEYLRLLCTKYDWDWPAGSGEDDLKKKKNQCIITLLLSSSLGGRTCPLFEQYLIPFTQGRLVPTLVMHIYV